MSNYIAVFERVEKKYLLAPWQYEGIIQTVNERMIKDRYGESTVLSLYLDTDDSLLIRRSVDKPAYKEKLRLRSYGVPGDDDTVYLEIKKKMAGVVYKRRVGMSVRQAMDCLEGGHVPGDTQIGRELDYMFGRYHPRAALVLAYDRTAYAETEETPDRLRLTIDRNIRSRENALDLRLGDWGAPLLQPDMRLMEVKTARAIPLWLCAALDQYQVRPASFSKYGSVYAARMRASAHVSPTASKEEATHVYRYV